MNGFSGMYQKLKHKRNRPRMESLQLLQWQKEQKPANEKVLEREEEMKNLQQAIDMLKNNCISLRTENEELHKKVDDLTSRISQLEEALKPIEKGRNAKPEKEKQAENETTTIDKLQQHQLMQQEDIVKINKENC